MNIKPKETQYKGYRFRSRLEARWAVYFDALDFEWEYEPEGFEIGGVNYLPDFCLYGVYFEVKRKGVDVSDFDKARLLAAAGKEVCFLEGNPDARFYKHISLQQDGVVYEDAIAFVPIGQKYSPFFYGYGAQQADGGGMWHGYAQEMAPYIAKANSARFEFGQVGAPDQWKRG